MKNNLIILLLLVTTPSFSQVLIHTVLPSETQPAIQNVHGPHRAYVPPANIRKGKLLVSIAGTGSSSEGMHTIDSVAARLGIHAISLDYKNNVITTVCRSSNDSTCFNSFRQEIVFGTPVSDTVKVDSANSIYNRIFTLLKFLNTKYPAEGWGTFVTSKGMNWSVIMVAGHSQGAGHAAYIGKYFLVDKVIALAGPQDFMDEYRRPAPWLSIHGKTPPARFFAFLHEDDPYGVGRQLNCNFLLSGTRKSVVIKGPSATLDPANVYVTKLITNDPHGSVMLPDHTFVLRSLLER